jgi:hypothetical protein
VVVANADAAVSRAVSNGTRFFKDHRG